MYTFNKDFKRIDWIYSEYANLNNTCLHEFLSAVNTAYYSNSANLYSSRFVKDIQAEYKKLFDCIYSDLNGRYVVDIGAGTGFEYDLLKGLSIEFSHFKYVEPSRSMIDIFMDRVGENLDEGISFHNGYFSDIVDQISEQNNKLLVLNSTLHHFIWIEPILDDLKSSMHSGDIFILGHEPNNSYSRVFLLLQKACKVFFASNLLRKIPGFSKISRVDSDRWKSINQDLIEKNIIVQEMSPLLIRRIIDYGVGYKNDWKKLGVPDKFNEGFWTIDDLSDYLGPDFKLLHFNTYRHLGDSNGNLILELFNNILRRMLKTSGSNFIAAWEKKNK